MMKEHCLCVLYFLKVVQGYILATLCYIIFNFKYEKYYNKYDIQKCHRPLPLLLSDLGILQLGFMWQIVLGIFNARFYLAN